MKIKLISLLICFITIFCLTPFVFMADETVVDETQGSIAGLWVGDVDLMTVEPSQYPAGVSFDKDTYELTLKDANITTGYSYNGLQVVSIYIVGEVDVAIILEGVNNVGSAEIYRAIYAIVPTLTIKGDGTLNATAIDDTITVGIEDSGAGDLIIQSGTIEVVSSNMDAIDVEGDMSILGGEITVNCDEEAFDVMGDLNIVDGDINLVARDNGIECNNANIQGGNITIKAIDDAIDVSKELIISGGTLMLESDDIGIDARSVIIHDGNITIKAIDDGMDISNDLTIYGGTLSIESDDIGIDVDDVIIRDGNITIKAIDEAMDISNDLTINGGTLLLESDDIGIDVDGDMMMIAGTLQINSYDDAIDIKNTLIIMGGSVTALSSLNYGLRSRNGDLIISDNIYLHVKGRPSAMYAYGSISISNKSYDIKSTELELKDGVITENNVLTRAPVSELMIGTVNILTGDPATFPAGVSYDANNAILTLNNASLTAGDNDAAVLVFRGDLIIHLIGNSTIDSTVENGIRFNGGDATFTGTGTLTVTAAEDAIYAGDILSVNVTELATLVLNGKDVALYAGGMLVLINGEYYTGKDSRITIKSSGYDVIRSSDVKALWVDGVDLLNSDISAYPKGVAYDPATKTLTLTNVTINNYVSIEDVFIEGIGEDSGIYVIGDINIQLVGTNYIDLTGNDIRARGICFANDGSRVSIYGDSLYIKTNSFGITGNAQINIGQIENLCIEATYYAFDTLYATNILVTLVSESKGYNLYTSGAIRTVTEEISPNSRYDFDPGTARIVNITAENAPAEEPQISVVKGTYIEGDSAGAIYSLDLVWGAMEFVYSVDSKGTWNTTTHMYEGATVEGWTCARGANTISVTNHSNVAVDVSLVFTGTTSQNVLCSFSESSGTSNDGILSLASAVDTLVDNAPSASVDVVLSGTIDQSVEQKTVIGAIVITINQAS